MHIIWQQNDELHFIQSSRISGQSVSIVFLFHLSRCDVALNGYCMYKIINYVVLDRQGNHGIGLVTDVTIYTFCAE